MCYVLLEYWCPLVVNAKKLNDKYNKYIIQYNNKVYLII